MALNSEGRSARQTMHLVYSFSCNLSCGHCIFRCGPDDRPTMGIGRAKAFIEQASHAGIRRIVFTGGEPLLHPRELRILVHHAAKRGMQSALITNAAYLSSRVQATAYLFDLKKMGLQSITLSTDQYHLREVSLAKLRTALNAAREVRLQAGVKIARLSHDPVAVGLYRSLRSSGTRLVVQEISPLGRATSLRSAVKLHPSSAFIGPGCSTPPVLLPNGALLTCCNLPAQDMTETDYPFVLGNAERNSLRSLLNKRHRDPLLIALRANGPSTLLPLLEPRDLTFQNRNPVGYHSRCDLCFHLFCRLKDKGRLYAILGKNPEIQYQSLGVPA